MIRGCDASLHQRLYSRRWRIIAGSGDECALIRLRGSMESCHRALSFFCFVDTACPLSLSAFEM
jgi:hypothetical protein